MYRTFGKESKRQYILERAWENECPECARKKKIESSEIKLEGSEKQIAWALDIRESMLKDLKWHIERLTKGIERLEERGRDSSKYKAELDEYTKLFERAQVETAARWFIDNRYYY